MARKWEKRRCHFVGSVCAWYNVTVRAVDIAFFFVVAALAGLAVRVAYRLQVQFRQAWLTPYTFYLASWSALVLLSVVQYLLIGSFLPETAWDQLLTATGPLFAVTLAVTLYFLSSFLAQITGGRLSRTYTIVYVGVCGGATVVISMARALGGGRSSTVAIAASILAFLLKTGVMYGWIAYVLLAVRRIEDPLERTGLRRFVLLQLGGFVAFDFVVRDPAEVLGIGATPDAVIALVQVGANYPALLWLGRFLRRRALVRPAEPLRVDAKADLVALGISAREADVVELVLTGLSHKEIADRLSISPDTVKKHTYNVYRKLGVQNRVQLSYFVQNRTARRG
jgi:DNA-binding CsgD family transcriptional regulator